MTSNVNGSIKEKACWDETNIAIFLAILVEEIDTGNRPAGHFTKVAWGRITQKFVDSSGCNFTIGQLKNKWDNLKKEFSLWEKLLLEETGLGYDHTTSRIVADPIWWRNKLQEKPEFRRFRTHGPIHLDLQEKIFRGIIATGYMEYVPGHTPFTDEGTHIDDVDETGADDDQGPNEPPFNMNLEDDVPPNTSGYRPTQTRTGRVKKRKRTTTSVSQATVGDVNDGMMNLIQNMNAESVSSIKATENDAAITYGQAIDMLRELPWMDIDGPYFTKGLVLLEERNKRIAFSHIIDLGENVIKNWMTAWSK